MREPNFPTEILRLGFNFITSYYGPVQNVTKTNSYGDALQGNRERMPCMRSLRSYKYKIYALSRTNDLNDVY